MFFCFVFVAFPGYRIDLATDILVGFSDKLRFMNLLMGDISKVYEFDVRSCRECRFSNGGQFFAAANGNLIQIFSTYTFENIGNLRGHSGKVLR